MNVCSVRTGEIAANARSAEGRASTIMVFTAVDARRAEGQVSVSTVDGLVASNANRQVSNADND